MRWKGCFVLLLVLGVSFGQAFQYYLRPQRTICDPALCTNGICSKGYSGDYCHCNNGFHNPQGNTSLCVDIDECRFKSMCPGGWCVNYLGSYGCECRHGFKQTADRKGCEVDPKAPYTNTHGFTEFLGSIGHKNPEYYLAPEPPSHYSNQYRQPYQPKTQHHSSTGQGSHQSGANQNQQNTNTAPTTTPAPGEVEGPEPGEVVPRGNQGGPPQPTFVDPAPSTNQVNQPGYGGQPYDPYNSQSVHSQNTITNTGYQQPSQPYSNSYPGPYATQDNFPVDQYYPPYSSASQGPIGHVPAIGPPSFIKDHAQQQYEPANNAKPSYLKENTIPTSQGSQSQNVPIFPPRESRQYYEQPPSSSGSTNAPYDKGSATVYSPAAYQPNPPEMVNSGTQYNPGFKPTSGNYVYDTHPPQAVQNHAAKQEPFPNAQTYNNIDQSYPPTSNYTQPYPNAPAQHMWPSQHQQNTYYYDRTNQVNTYSDQHYQAYPQATTHLPNVHTYNTYQGQTGFPQYYQSGSYQGTYPYSNSNSWYQQYDPLNSNRQYYDYRQTPTPYAYFNPVNVPGSAVEVSASQTSQTVNVDPPQGKTSIVKTDSNTTPSPVVTTPAPAVDPQTTQIPDTTTEGTHQIIYPVISTGPDSGNNLHIGLNVDLSGPSPTGGPPVPEPSATSTHGTETPAAVKPPPPPSGTNDVSVLVDLTATNAQPAEAVPQTTGPKYDYPVNKNLYPSQPGYYQRGTSHNQPIGQYMAPVLTSQAHRSPYQPNEPNPFVPPVRRPQVLQQKPEGQNPAQPPYVLNPQQSSGTTRLPVFLPQQKVMNSVNRYTKPTWTVNTAWTNQRTNVRRNTQTNAIPTYPRSPYMNPQISFGQWANSGTSGQRATTVKDPLASDDLLMAVLMSSIIN